jgi:hypothetical protein
MSNWQINLMIVTLINFIFVKLPAIREHLDLQQLQVIINLYGRRMYQFLCTGIDSLKYMNLSITQK